MERGMQVKSDMNKEGWEEADFPNVCETCLGESAYVRMTKEPYGKACKICERPFTIFRWKAGSGRFKKTEICVTCSKTKNVCQTCVLDLVYGLPVEVRDSFLAKHDPLGIVVPQSDVGREYHAMQQLKAADDGDLPIASQRIHDGLLALARKNPRYERNRAHLCSFFARGECTRGSECPYRHEMPRDKDDPLAKQNIKDRYAGKNDPVAAKILARARQREAQRRPANPSQKRLYIGGLTEHIGREDLTDALYSFGEITAIRVVPRQKCAFVEFATAEQANGAMMSRQNSLVIKGVKLVMNWAQGAKGGATGGAPGTGAPALLGAGTAPLRVAKRYEPPTAPVSVPGAAPVAPVRSAPPAAAAAAAAAPSPSPVPAPKGPEAYPGQHLGLPPPPGFMGGGMAPMGFAAGTRGGTGPVRPNTRAPRERNPMYPSMSSGMGGSRLPAM